MKGLFSCLVLLAFSGVFARDGLKTKVTPVQKVIEMLSQMKASGEKAKHEEQVQFAGFKQFCDDTSVEKKRVIKEAEESIEMLTADIQKYQADAAQMSAEIAEHNADISAWTGDMKAATTVRELEKADYTALHTDYAESIDALKRAIDVLKKQAYDRKQAVALSQVSKLRDMQLIPAEAKRAIAVFLAQEPDELEVTAPEAHGYEFQSGHIIEILEKLLDKFVQEKTDLEKAEMNSKHAYDMLMQDLTAQNTQAKNAVDSKTQAKAKAMQSKADAAGELQDTSTTKSADEKYLADLTSTCAQKASDFEARQKLRTEELQAIAEAIEILSSAEVSGHADTYLPSLVQSKAGKPRTALAQIRGKAPTVAQDQLRAANFLQGEAAKLNSRVLSTLAAHMTSDPFAKVKKMIKDLLVRLMEEANEEAEHKGWCDTELATNEQTRKEKTEAVESLHAAIDELEASIAQLSQEISDLSADVAELEAAMAKATTLRQEEKANNTKTVADSKEAQAAVAQALTILREFYAKAGEATAFMQQQPVAPAIFESPYKGMQAESGGVIGMLQVIQTDFARLEAETTASEAVSQKEYDEFMTLSEVDKATKNKDIEHKTAKKQDENQALILKKEDLEGTEKELNAALAYFDKLKPSCVDAGMTYDDRVERRKEEIESLQTALRILNGEELP